MHVRVTVVIDEFNFVQACFCLVLQIYKNSHGPCNQKRNATNWKVLNAYL